MQRRRDEPRVFFPWERRRGFWSFLGRARARQIFLGVAALTALYVFHERERRESAVRETRAEITFATNAVAAWRADHDGTCPGNLADLVVGGYVHGIPKDAWGHPLRVTCPGRRDPKGFEVASDGPDGEMGGIDKVE
jgi:general secretion pathway protein G